MDYIENPEIGEGCLFCHCLDMEDGVENLILHREGNAFVILNRYPYVNGHMMIVPKAHEASLEALPAPTRMDLVELATKALRVLKEVYQAEAFNLGINIGEAAGAGIAEHVHMHVLPRWSGDTSFMTTAAQTRVMPEDLQISYRRLRDAWHNLSDPD
jgi:ATP adenylyltransferase